MSEQERNALVEKARNVVAEVTAFDSLYKLAMCCQEGYVPTLRRKGATLKLGYCLTAVYGCKVYWLR